MRDNTKCSVSLFAISLILFPYFPGCTQVSERAITTRVSDSPEILIVDDGEDENSALNPYIVGGQTDNGHSSVGLLQTGNSLCTATLIGKKTVLTARHCVSSGSSKFKVGGQTYASVSIHTHSSVDVAVVILNQAPAGVSPSPIFTTKPAVGEPITIVGFGYTGTNAGGVGTKRVGQNKISYVGSTTFRFQQNSNLCQGDSGGPAFISVSGQEHLAGVHSMASVPCGSVGIDVRVDIVQNWLSQVSNGDVATSGQGGTNPPNNTPPNNSPPDNTPPDNTPPNSACHQGANFDWNYCSEACPCNEGEGDCETDNECASGLVCTQNAGQKYNVDPRVDVCEKADGDPNPQNPTVQSAEGESCADKACESALACVPVYGSSTGKLLGKYCMERCQSLGTDPSCESGEVCSQSKTAGPVCFNSQNPQQGYTTPGSGGAQTPTPTPSPTPTPPPSGDSGHNTQEEGVFQLLNQVRAENGLGAVQPDEKGITAARGHSQDMCDRGYFSHVSPDGKEPWDRLRAAGAQFTSAGENIAQGYRDAQSVHNGWMNSSGHRQNMLNGSWTRVGIGFVSCNGKNYWTEVFMR